MLGIVSFFHGPLALYYEPLWKVFISHIHSTLTTKQMSKVADWKELMEWIITTYKIYVLRQAFIFFNKVLHLRRRSRDERDPTLK